MPKIVSLPNAKSIEPKDLNRSSKLSDNNGNGGEPPMDNKYVTHQELELSNEKMLRHIDNKFADMQSKMDNKFANMQNQFRDIDKKIDLTNEKINTKFEKQKVWFYGTGIAIVSITCTIIGFLIKFIK